MIDRKYYYKLDEIPKSILINHVLIKLDVLNKKRTTKSGILMTSGKEDDQLDNTDIFHQIDRYGEVVLAPEKVFFSTKSKLSLDWETSVEIEVGDVVWTKQIESNTADRFEIKGEYYKLIKYDALIVAKRGTNIIPLNGYVLMEEVFEEQKGSIVNPFKKQIKNQGIVKYVGSSNLDYKSNYAYKGDKLVRMPIWFDDDVNVGDRVQFELVRNRKVDPIYLESDYINNFGEKLMICQKRHIQAIL